MEQVTLGGDRLGSGNKLKVGLHGFERSNHDLSYIWRSTMAAGTLVPFMCEVGLPGDTIDIDLQGVCLTNPTVGPLFGSYKIQYDVFQVPIRLYNSWLHNNKLEVGRNMAQVKLPQVELKTGTITPPFEGWEQINPSCLLAYLGIRGVGTPTTWGENISREFNGIPLMAYWEIYKNYYANKQEEIGAFINANTPTNISQIRNEDTSTVIPEFPDSGSVECLNGATIWVVFDTTKPLPDINKIVFRDDEDAIYNYDDIINFQEIGVGEIVGTMKQDLYIKNWGYEIGVEPLIDTFPLNEIDELRERMLATAGNTVFSVNATDLKLYRWMNGQSSEYKPLPSYVQQGLGLKTYQSDIFNNWLNEAWISDVATQSAVSTLAGSFTIDELTIKKKVWELLNRIAVSGGSYDDWIMATYDQKPFNRAENPVYIGGMSQELIFQQVVSTAHTNVGGIQDTNQPLGTLAGKGNIDHKSHRGGKIIAKCSEHCYIIGIVSLTPRIDYSQGNRWDTHLQTMDDFHKPSLDQIGFQDLITEQMAWFDTYYDDSTSTWVQRSAGKQPAWINYQTNFNRTYGNFAIPLNEMFMTLNRRYEQDYDGKLKDLTTYIDPSKYNFIFASTKVDAQNFWMQIGVNIEARRKMSAKIMPNL
jgi:hypothetical protein